MLNWGRKMGKPVRGTEVACQIRPFGEVVEQKESWTLLRAGTLWRTGRSKHLYKIQGQRMGCISVVYMISAGYTGWPVGNFLTADSPY